AALPDGRVVVTGGLPLHMTTYAPLGSVEVWDPATGTWSESAPLAEGRAWGVMIRVGPALYLVSGNGANETAFGTVERLTVD
ncbi:MAG: galactose oxidase, partial [Chloroflexi bacterium]